MFSKTTQNFITFLSNSSQGCIFRLTCSHPELAEDHVLTSAYDSIATVGEIRVYRRADFQSGSRVLKKVF